MAGCQTAPVIQKHGGLDNAGFMSLWETYRACQGSTDIDTMQLASRRLTQVAHQPVDAKNEIYVPKPLQRWVSEHPARLSVDPKSMAAACSLYAGQAALNAGRHDVADEMFRSVLNNPAGTSSYYMEQAKSGLTQVALANLVSTASPLQTPRLVSLEH